MNEKNEKCPSHFPKAKADILRAENPEALS